MPMGFSNSCAKNNAATCRYNALTSWDRGTLNVIKSLPWQQLTLKMFQTHTSNWSHIVCFMPWIHRKIFSKHKPRRGWGKIHCGCSIIFILNINDHSWYFTVWKWRKAHTYNRTWKHASTLNDFWSTGLKLLVSSCSSLLELMPFPFYYINKFY